MKAKREKTSRDNKQILFESRAHLQLSKKKKDKVEHDKFIKLLKSQKFSKVYLQSALKSGDLSSISLALNDIEEVHPGFTIRLLIVSLLGTSNKNKVRKK